MQTVLFVDDNPQTLDGYKRLFQSQKCHWNAIFADNAGLAVDLLETRYIDVIISDLEMPIVNGAILLQHVKKVSPHTIRIILSGCSEDKMIMETVKSAHRIFPKPSSYEAIIDILDRSYYLHQLIMSPNARRILMEVGTIPSIPLLLQEIMIAVEDESCSLNDIAKMISQDMGMSVNILRLVNSPYFGLPNEIVSIEQAVSLLGLEIIKTLIISVHFFESFKTPHEAELDELLNHSLNTANFCKKIFTSMKRNREESDRAFITGFMHDLGKLILMSYFPQKYSKFIAKLSEKENSADTISIEQAFFEANHGEIGAFLLGLWGFKDETIEAVAFHHSPMNAKYVDPLLLAALHCADVYEHEIRESMILSDTGTLDVAFLEKTGFIDKEEEWLQVCRSHFEKA